MRLQSIELQGFLSHRDTSIDLADVSAAVLVGDNGAGKTSIVEGVAWALFGSAASRGRPDNMVSTGESRCRVAVEFELGPTRYRVERERIVSGGGKSSLTLTANGAALGGAHVAETQAAICDLLKMDGDTWLASSFLGQGAADAFTKLRPAGRQALLREILGIGRYEAVAERARAEQRTVAGRAIEVQRQIEQLEAVVAGEEETRRRVAVADAEKASAAVTLVDRERELEERRRALEEAKAELASLSHIRDKLEHLRGQRHDRRARAEEDVRRVEKELASLQEEDQKLELEIQKCGRSERMATDMEADRVAATTEAQVREREADEVRAAARQASADAAAALERSNALAARAKEAGEKIELLSRIQDKCIACGQPVTREHREREVEKYSDDETRLKREGAEASATAKHHQRIQGEREEQAERIAAEARQLREKAEASARGAERARAQGDRLDEARTARETARSRLTELVEEQPKLRRAFEDLEAPSEEEAELTSQIAKRDVLVAQANVAGDELDAAQRAVGVARDALREADIKLAREADALVRIGDARQELERAGARHRELVERQTDEGLYAHFFGRTYLQARVIEAAVPQIEDEANRLLDRFTDGRFVVRLETEVPKKNSDEVRDTLKIFAHADGFQRELEELSGGERQVCDLALRISLARLVAHRAGAPIETLVIDEGFTALDAGRRQRAVEVLRGLQQEFRVILAVTHDPDFAQAFPTRIHVSNDGTGSVIDVQQLEAVA